MTRPRLNKKRREIFISKVSNEEGDITTDVTYIQMTRNIEKTRNPNHSQTLKDSQTHGVRLVLQQHQCDGQVDLVPEKQGWFNSWELINAIIPHIFSPTR